MRGGDQRRDDDREDQAAPSPRRERVRAESRRGHDDERRRRPPVWLGWHTAREGGGNDEAGQADDDRPRTEGHARQGAPPIHRTGGDQSSACAVTAASSAPIARAGDHPPSARCVNA